VLIAGGGPVGLLCAWLLGRQGVRVRVFDDNDGLRDDPRAATTHPATLDLLSEDGLADDMARLGLVAPVFQFWDRPSGELVASFDHAILKGDTAHPFVVQCEQFKTAKLVLERLAKFPNVEVLFGHEVVDVTQRDGALSVAARGPEGVRRHTGAWLIGADGGRSTVRKILGIEFEGFTWPEKFVVASTPYDFAQHGFALNSYISDPIDWAAVFKMPDTGASGIWRAAFPGDPELPEEALLEAETIERTMQRIVPRAERYDIRYKSVYRVHQRVAKTFRDGRVLIAGDAAHLNNPMGGFGLNSGIHDAVNLADKLGRVWRGADEALLDLYVRQRRGATIEQVQAMSIHNKRLLEERDPKVQREQLAELIAIAGDPRRARKLLLESSMISGVRRSMEVA
jgi:3-(3-hydroxy-phenyl)propionate hydroxylase